LQRPLPVLILFPIVIVWPSAIIKPTIFILSSAIAVTSRFRTISIPIRSPLVLVIIEIVVCRASIVSKIEKLIYSIRAVMTTSLKGFETCQHTVFDYHNRRRAAFGLVVSVGAFCHGHCKLHPHTHRRSNSSPRAVDGACGLAFLRVDSVIVELPVDLHIHRCC
jgi:hypothetical protein